MNKEFEKQYRNYITEQVPDMWDRIETGLKEKNYVERYLEEERNTEKKEEGRIGGGQSVLKRKKTAVVFFPAAVVFLCFWVSKILMENHPKSNDMTAYHSMTFEENGFVQSTYPAENPDHADMAGSADMGAMLGNELGADAWEGEAAEAVEEMKAGEGTTDTAIFLCARVKIIEIMEAAESEYDAIYLAEIVEIVEKAEEPVLKTMSVGTEIYFYTGEDTDKAEGETPEIGEEYEVILELVSGEEDFFAKKINFIP